MLEVQSHLNCFVYIVPSSGSCRVSSELTAYIKLLVSDDFAIVLLCSCVICFLEKKTWCNVHFFPSEKAWQSKHTHRTVLVNIVL
jgi:hypothetical protein